MAVNEDKHAQECKYQQAQGLMSSEIDGELVLMSVENGFYYGLDSIGADIWVRLEQPVSLEQLVDQLCEEYAAERSKIRQDVQSLLDDMRAQNILQVL